METTTNQITKTVRESGRIVFSLPRIAGQRSELVSEITRDASGDYQLISGFMDGNDLRVSYDRRNFGSYATQANAERAAVRAINRMNSYRS